MQSVPPGLCIMAVNAARDSAQQFGIVCILMMAGVAVATWKSLSKRLLRRTFGWTPADAVSRGIWVLV